MNIVDIIIILIILSFGVIGANRGVFKQLVTTIGFIIVMILAFYLKNPIAEFLSLHLPFIKFSGFANASSFNIIFYQVISFIIVVLVLEIILQSIIKITGVIEKLLKYTVVLGVFSKILGFIVGVVEGFAIVFLVLFFLKQPAINVDIINESKLTPGILKSTPVLSNISHGMVKTFNDLYELKNDYMDDKIDENTLNLKSIDVMLEHKIITPRYVRKLVDANKIEIVGIDSLINKYEED